MKVVMIAKPGHADSGVGRYVERLVPAIEAAGHEVRVIYPKVPLPLWLLKVVKKWLGWDLQEFLLNYPIWITYPPADIYHYSSQNLATLLLFHPPLGKMVVTVHDIIPYLMRKQGMASSQTVWMQLFDWLSNQGVKRANYLICDSTATMQNLNQEFGIPPENMRIIFLGIDESSS